MVVYRGIKPGNYTRIGRIPSVTTGKFLNLAVLRKARFFGSGTFWGEEIVSPCADIILVF